MASLIEKSNMVNLYLNNHPELENDALLMNGFKLFATARPYSWKEWAGLEVIYLQLNTKCDAKTRRVHKEFLSDLQKVTIEPFDLPDSVVPPVPPARPSRTPPPLPLQRKNSVVRLKVDNSFSGKTAPFSFNRNAFFPVPEVDKDGNGLDALLGMTPPPSPAR